MNFAHFCEFNFCSGMPLRKVHELTFLWFWFARATPDSLFRNSALETVCSVFCWGGVDCQEALKGDILKGDI